MMQERRSIAWLQAGPMMFVFALFFLLPLVLVIIVSAWDYNEYEMIPAFSLRGYTDTFEGCIADLPNLCTILKTYLKTVKLCLLTWMTDAADRLHGGLFPLFSCPLEDLADRALSALHHSVLDLERDPHDRLDSAAGPQRPGQQGSAGCGSDTQPVEWLLFSEFSVVLALVHLFTFFMVVPIFNSMIRIDKRLIEAAYDAGATGWQTLVNVIIPLAKPGIVIGSIFVVTIVMGDFITIGVMGGQQIASAGKIIETRLNALQFPAAAANAVILLGITILIISSLTRIVDIRKEL